MDNRRCRYDTVPKGCPLSSHRRPQLRKGCPCLADCLHSGKGGTMTETSCQESARTGGNATAIWGCIGTGGTFSSVWS